MLALDKEEEWVHPKDRVYDRPRDAKRALEMGYMEQYLHEHQNPSDDENYFIRDFIPTYQFIQGIVKKKAPAFNLDPAFRTDPIAQFMMDNHLGVRPNHLGVGLCDLSDQATRDRIHTLACSREREWFK